MILEQLGAAIDNVLIGAPFGSPPGNDDVSDLPNLIGLTGKAGAGKSTLANILANKRGFVHSPFAGPIKRMFVNGLGVPAHIAYGDADKKELPCRQLSGITFRQAAQTLGTDWGRKMMHPDFWVHRWAEHVDPILDRGFSVVADDVRFENEVMAILDRGGIVIAVKREGAGVQHAELAKHESETQDLFSTFEITNFGAPSTMFNDLRTQWARHA